MRVAESIVLPLQHDAASQLYRDLLTASRDVTPDTPDMFDAAAAARVGSQAAALVFEEPETAARVICALLVALAAADRTLAQIDCGP